MNNNLTSSRKGQPRHSLLVTRVADCEHRSEPNGVAQAVAIAEHNERSKPFSRHQVGHSESSEAITKT